MNEVEVLAKVSLFSGMKASDLERIASLAQSHVFQAGETIIREGDRDGRLFVVVSGEVDVIKGLGKKNERYVRTLGPLSYFGEMALIDDLVRSASVVAKGETGVLILDQWSLHQDIERYPAMAFELMRMLSQRIRAIEKTIVDAIGGLLPICAHCKKIREDDGSWVSIEKYISDHSEAEFSHGLCPDCVKELYPQYAKRLTEEKEEGS
ncbi:MAG: cyclic nucleotide-binding domain-containing protein [Desulfobacteraceae bacterium]|jgi:CRP-like cAMP-binding protein